MAIGVSALTSGSDITDLTTYTTASVSPAANAGLLLFVVPGRTDGATASSATITALGLTWTLVDSSAITGNNLRGLLYQAVTGGSAPTPGTVSINFGATQHNASWHLIQCTGIDTAAFVRQNANGSASGTAAALTVTLGAAVESDSAVLGFMAINTQTFGWSAGSGSTLVGTEQSIAGPTQRTVAEYDLTSQTTISATPAGGTAGRFLIGVEVSAASGSIVLGLTPATETDAAVALGRRKARGTAPVAGTDTAVTLGRRKARGVASAAETDAAVALVRQKARSLSAAGEIDAAVALTRAKTRTLAPATGTDSTVPLGRRKSRTLTAAPETDTTVALGRVKARTRTPATETDTAVPLTQGETPVTDADLTPATETDTAVQLGRRKVRTLTPATEVDSAIGVTARAPHRPADPDRLFTVARPARVLTVPAAPRTIVVVAETRTATVPAEVRTIAVPAEPRRLT